MSQNKGSDCILIKSIPELVQLKYSGVFVACKGEKNLSIAHRMNRETPLSLLSLSYIY